MPGSAVNTGNVSDASGCYSPDGAVEATADRTRGGAISIGGSRTATLWASPPAADVRQDVARAGRASFVGERADTGAGITGGGGSSGRAGGESGAETVCSCTGSKGGGGGGGWW